MARNEPEDPDVRPWERWTIAACGREEPAALFAVFDAWLRTSPRSIRAALARVRGLEGDAAKNIRASGALQRSVRLWRWSERAAAWDLHLAEEEKARLDAHRLAARRRRIDQLDRLNVAIGLRLAALAKKATLESLLRLHEAEREELRDAREDDAKNWGQYEPPLPAIEDVIKPPPESVDGEPPEAERKETP